MRSATLLIVAALLAVLPRSAGVTFGTGCDAPTGRLDANAGHPIGGGRPGEEGRNLFRGVKPSVLAVRPPKFVSSLKTPFTHKTNEETKI